jgi:hypothetical protein
MDSFAEPPSFDVYISIEELAEELEYQKVLLISLTNVADRAAAEAAIKREISRLENQIRTLTQCQKGSAAMPEARSYFTNAFDDDPFTSAPTSCAPGGRSLLDLCGLTFLPAYLDALNRNIWPLFVGKAY